MALRVGRRRADPVVPEAPKPDKRKRSFIPRGIASRVALLIAVLVVAASLGAFDYDHASAQRFFPGTHIGDLVIGSRTADEAALMLHDRFVLPLRRTITITAPDYTTTTTPWDLGMRLDVDSIVHRALNQQHRQALGNRLWHRVLGVRGSMPVRPDTNELIFDTRISQTFSSINQDPQDAKLQIIGGKLHVVPHKVGRRVDTAAAKRLVFQAIQNGETTVALPVKTTEPQLKTSDFKQVIVVSTSANTLELYRDGKVLKKYRVATGTGGYPTPHGQFRITEKRYMPTWRNPHDAWSVGMPEYIGPGPNNPLGTRAMNLDADGIRIHGTPHDSSIGSNASHGCIRMHIHEAEELYGLVTVNTPVLIV